MSHLMVAARIAELISILESARIHRQLRINRNWRKLAGGLGAEIDELLRLLSCDSLNQALYHLRMGISEPPTCPTCGSAMKFGRTYTRFCSPRCSASAESTKRKREETNLSRFGHAHPACAPEVKERVLKERTERYGENPSHLFGGPSFKKRLFDLYGVSNAAQAFGLKGGETNRKRFTERMIEQAKAHGFTYQGGTMKSREKHRFTCDSCLTDVDFRVFAGRSPRCPTCQPYNLSSQHVRVRNWLQERGISFRENDRTVLKPLELDFLLPEHALAIEVNGVYWHSDEAGTDRFYHQRKTLACLEAGVTLVHLFEDQIDLHFEATMKRVEDTYLMGANLPFAHEVDGSWPLPQSLKARLVKISEPQPYKIDENFRPRLKGTVWTSGTLFYEPK